MGLAHTRPTTMVGRTWVGSTDLCLEREASWKFPLVGSRFLPTIPLREGLLFPSINMRGGGKNRVTLHTITFTPLSLLELGKG